MVTTLAHRVLLGVIIVASAVGVIDAAIGEAYDHVVLHGVVVVGALAMLVRATSRRRPVPVRADLYRWLQQYAVEGGEEVDRVTDRALSAYRDGFTVHVDLPDGRATRP